MNIIELYDGLKDCFIGENAYLSIEDRLNDAITVDIMYDLISHIENLEIFNIQPYYDLLNIKDFYLAILYDLSAIRELYFYIKYDEGINNNFSRDEILSPYLSLVLTIVDLKHHLNSLPSLDILKHMNADQK